MSERDTKRLAALSSRSELAEKINWLRELGPRETGNSDHQRFVTWIADQLSSLGLTVRRDTFNFDRWSSAGSECSLTIRGTSAGDLTVPVASAYPYSGSTNPTGIAAPLHLVGYPYWWFGCRGKIAVIEVPHPAVPVNLLLDRVSQLPADATGFPDHYRHPGLSAYAFGPKFVLARLAGAVGVVAIWKGLTRAQAADQYVRFDLPYQHVPAVWVADEDSQHLVDHARRGAEATLVLNAPLQRASTDTVWTVVEGEITSESILVISHTDGVNAVEENGAIGILELARVFAQGPRAKRTIVLIFVTGHLRIPAVTDQSHAQATTAWLAAHPEWWSSKDGGPRAVAGLVIEHIGALANARRANEAVEPAPELIYATNAMMQKILKESWPGRQRGKALIAEPNGLFQIGEGEPLYKLGIPAIALASVPEYLLAVTKSDVVDVDLMQEQIATFARALCLIERTPAPLLGRAKRAGLLKKLSTLIQIAWTVARVQLRF